MLVYDNDNIAKLIDHALLKPEMTSEEVRVGVIDALKYNTASVCVKGCDVSIASSLLRGSEVAVGTVVGFPHGAAPARAKVYETKAALENGAHEIDMVINIARVRGGDYSYAANEVKDIFAVCRGDGAVLKVIFENCFLTEENIITLCKITSEIGVDYIKTSTGFGVYGARLEDVILMRKYAADNIKIKAAGGIKTYEELMSFHKAGADRIGTSSTSAILAQAEALRNN